jgi:phage shock protein PspC (stress-responsive transcriptional regulator)
MNKTVTINVSGIIFHIEEDGYEKLSKYLSTIKGYFKDSEGRDEIVSDIEARIAEMLQQRVSPVKQVIVMDDVDHVITVMGRPEEFSGETEEEQKSGQTDSDYTSSPGKRKRVFRDTDDKILGGVCSGIGHYFGIDPLWLRLALAISFFVFGFGFLLYLLLWIIIPKANTTAEKLEMRGEAINISSIHKTFTDEMDELKKRMKDFKAEASGLGSKENKEKIKRGAGRFGEFIEEFFRMLGTIIGKFFGGLMIIIGIALLITLLASTFGLHSHNIHFGINSGNMSASFNELFHLLFNDSKLMMFSLVSLILLLGVPCLMMMYGGIRVLFGLGKRNKIIGVISTLLVLSGLFMGLYVIYQVSGDFSIKSKSVKSTAVKVPDNTLYVRLQNTQKPGEDVEEYSHLHKWDLFSIHDNNVYGYYPSLDILASATDSFEVCIVTSARGVSSKEALSRAKNITYTFALHDSVLVLDPYFSFALNDKWREQNVHILIKVPRNRMIHLSKNLKPMVHNADINNLQDTEDEDMLGRRWIMTDEGLNCVDCGGLEIIHSRPEPPKPPQPPVNKVSFSGLSFSL